MPPRKRQAVEAPATPETSGGRRRSTRISSAGKKSQYFDDDSDSDDHLSDAPTGKGKANGKKTTPQRGRGKPTAKKAKIAHDEDDDEDVYAAPESEEDGPAKYENDEEDDDDFDEDGAPRVTIIPHVKLRDTGGVDYEDDRLHKNTLLFLNDLRANNRRPWLKSHDEEYRRALKDWNTYVETFTQKLIALDPTIPELPLKDVVFRIYRDIRFTNDPTPYKAFFSAAWSRTGRKGPYACYYLHVDPGAAFVGGGLWHPDAGHLAKLRASIDERPRRWRRVLMDEEFRAAFLPKAKRGDEKSCLEAFAEANRENALKTKPKGFIAEHRDIELLKLRSFTVSRKVIDDKVLTARDGQEQIGRIVKAMVGFVTFLNNVVMPDLNLDDDSSSDDYDNIEDADENGTDVNGTDEDEEEEQ